MTTKITKLFICLFIIGFSFFLFSCDTIESNENSLSISFVSESPLPKISNAGFQIEEVKLQLKEIKIKNYDNENEIEVKAGPMIVNLNLTGHQTVFASSGIPPGNYDRVRFEIHKMQASDSGLDPEFQDENDSSQRFSVIVKGSLSGESFVYRFRKSADQDIELDEPLSVGEKEAVNLTITVDPYSWFYEGDTFLSPVNTADQSKIENKMKYAFKRAFADNDHDGNNG